jgi:predicted DCC family thiol-disulfide oxidoreductase YuxK
VGTDGERASAHVAVARTLVHGGKGWAVLGRVILLPGVEAVAGVVYRWVARNRHRMPGGTAQCNLPASERTK